jgi:hypothetical protein
MAQYDHDLMLKHGQAVRLVKIPKFGIEIAQTYENPSEELKVGDIGVAKYITKKGNKAFIVYFGSGPDLDYADCHPIVCYPDEIEFI